MPLRKVETPFERLVSKGSRLTLREIAYDRQDQSRTSYAGSGNYCSFRSTLSSTLLPKRPAAQAANPSISAASDRFEEAEIKVGDSTIFIRRYGNGSPLLMVHGFPRSSLMWRFVAPQLASNRTVICVDLRGYAHSGVPDFLRRSLPLYEARNGQ